MTRDRNVALWFAQIWPDLRGGSAGPRILHLQAPKSDLDRLRVIKLEQNSEEYERLTDAWNRGRDVPADLEYLISDYDAIDALVKFPNGEGQQFKFNPRAQSFVDRYPFFFEELR